MVALKNVLKYWLWLMTVAAISSCDRETGSDAPMAAPEPAPITMVVNVTVGTISGTVGEDGLKVYQGIPYAAPPVGDLRWSATAPVVS
jgi:para-nitrobenzyl esterase